MEPWPEDMPQYALYLCFHGDTPTEAAIARWHERIGPEPPGFVRDVQGMLRLGPVERRDNKND